MMTEDEKLQFLLGCMVLLVMVVAVTLIALIAIVPICCHNWYRRTIGRKCCPITYGYVDFDGTPLPQPEDKKQD